GTCWPTPPPGSTPPAPPRPRPRVSGRPGRRYNRAGRPPWWPPSPGNGTGRRTMAKKVLLVADPGIDTAFAVALALHDPGLDVLALVPTAGNVSAEQATVNCHVLIDLLDPPKWPRL